MDETFRVLKLVNHDEQFSISTNQAGVEPIILNMWDLSNPDAMTEVSNLLFSDGKGSDFMARCQCGYTEGNNKVGMICPVCETTVTMTTLLDDDHLVCRTWLTAPRDLPYGWLTPKIYLNLAEWLSYGRHNHKRNYLDDILDVDAETPFELKEIFPGKGFTYLYENFDRFIEYFTYSHPVISAKPDTKAMNFCLKLNRDKIFCRYIPIMNAAITPTFSPHVSGDSRRRYTDPTADNILRAAVSLSSLEHSVRKKHKEIHTERTAFRAYRDIIQYVQEATSKFLSVKYAIPRQHIFGSRLHWSFRAVIVPIVGPHADHELHVPFAMAVNTLRVQLTGILCRDYRMPLNQAVAKIRNGLLAYDQDLMDIMNRLIQESPFGGIPVLWDRPPSIRDGSVQLKFWTQIKPDMGDSAIAMTPIDVPLQNADKSSLWLFIVSDI